MYVQGRMQVRISVGSLQPVIYHMFEHLCFAVSAPIYTNCFPVSTDLLT